MKYSIILITVLSFFSCADKPKIDNAVKAAKAVNTAYGSCKYEMGKTVNINDTVNFYTVTISGNKYLKQFDDLSIPASNIALIFYSNLSNPKAIDQVHVNILLGENSEFVFSADDIKLFQHKKNVFNRINQLIINKQYNELYNSFSKEAKKSFNKSNLIKLFENQAEEFGESSNIYIRGFIYLTATVNNNKEMTFIKSMETIERVNNNTKLTLLIDIKTDKIYTIEFDW